MKQGVLEREDPFHFTLFVWAMQGIDPILAVSKAEEEWIQMDRLNRWTNGNRSSKVTTPPMRRLRWSKSLWYLIPRSSMATHTATHSATVTHADISGPEIEAGPQNPPQTGDTGRMPPMVFGR